GWPFSRAVASSKSRPRSTCSMNSPPLTPSCAPSARIASKPSSMKPLRIPTSGPCIRRSLNVFPALKGEDFHDLTTAMMNKRKRKSKLAPFVPVTKTTMATPAWRAMSLGARMLYIELRGRLRNDCLNNGKVFLSCRLAAKAIGVRPGSVARWYMENEHFGFLRKTGEGFLGVDGRGIAARYRFTEFRCEDQPSTRDFEKWNGKPFVFTPRRPSRKKQNPVTPRVTPRVAKRHIR